MSECISVCACVCVLGKRHFFLLAGKSELAKTHEGFAIGFTDNPFSLFRKETLETR